MYIDRTVYTTYAPSWIQLGHKRYVYSISVWRSSLSHWIACLFLVFQCGILIHWCSHVLIALEGMINLGRVPTWRNFEASGWCRCWIWLICTTLTLLPSVISTFTGLLMLQIVHFPFPTEIQFSSCCRYWQPNHACLQHQSVVTVNGCHTLSSDVVQLPPSLHEQSPEVEQILHTSVCCMLCCQMLKRMQMMAALVVFQSS